MIIQTQTKWANLFLFISALLAVSYAYFYMEKTLYLVPCPLCYAQRLIFVLVAVFFFWLMFIKQNTVMQYVIASLSVVILLGGVALSIRHLYIQNLPKDEIPDCGLDFYGLIQNAPFAETLYTMLTGSGDCAEIQWTFLSLSIPAWTLVIYLIMLVITIVYNFKKR